MTQRPDDVNQEAWDAAERLELRLVQSRSNEETMDCIARAIMAAKAEEREKIACALEAGEYNRQAGDPMVNMKIIKAIRDLE